MPVRVVIHRDIHGTAVEEITHKDANWTYVRDGNLLLMNRDSHGYEKPVATYAPGSWTSAEVDTQ